MSIELHQFGSVERAIVRPDETWLRVTGPWRVE